MRRILVNLIAIIVVTTVFTFLLNRIVDYYTGPKLVMEVHFNEEYYKPGDLIIIDVYVYSKEFLWGRTPLRGAVVAIQIVDPRGNTVFVFRNITDSLGKTEFKVRADKNWVSGEYTVYIVTPGYMTIKKFKVE